MTDGAVGDGRASDRQGAARRWGPRAQPPKQDGEVPLRIRPAVRAVVFDPADRVLLVRFEFPDVTVWALPGGGVEPDEDEEAALRRELDEELGLDDVEIGPHVWTRTHIIPFMDGSYDGQRDHVHVVRVPDFEPAPRISWEQLRAERVHELRWWTVREVEAATDVRFAPRRLAAELTTLLRDGPPPEPIDVGI